MILPSRAFMIAAVILAGMTSEPHAQSYFNMSPEGSQPPDALNFSPAPAQNGAAAPAPPVRSTVPALPVPSGYGAPPPAAQAPLAPSVAAQPAPAAGDRPAFFPMSPSAQAPPPPAQPGAGGLPMPGLPAASPPGAAIPRAPITQAKARVGEPSRFIVPYSKLRLEGEVDGRSWVVFLTPDEAGRQAQLSVGYINAVMVMPEASRLRVSLNNQLVLDAPITSSSKPARISVQLNPGLLRPGANLVRMEALQRHRTDCNFQATYELWTDIVSSMTGLNFGPGAAIKLRNLDDLPALGVDALGRTNIRMIVPGGMNAQVSDRLIRLSQAIALRGRYAHPVVTVADRDPGNSPGSINVLVGTSADLSRSLGSSFPGASNRSLATFLTDPRFVVPTLVVTGVTWSDVDSTIATIEQPVTPSSQSVPRVYETSSWLAPNVPIVTGASSLSLASLDIPTQEFSGRRFHVRFTIGLPIDFYASAYGQAMLYLDAAYSSAVEQASHFDVYVNGNIASTVDLDAGDGDILRHSPVKIPMKHFRPGLNEVVLEALLLTDDDTRCGPAATVPGSNRLVLFNTTEFWMPNFARIARLPSLDAFSATGYPYNAPDTVTALVLGRQNAATQGAAATLFARLAQSAGRPIPVDSSATVATINSRPAIFVGLANELPPELFSQLSVSDRARTEWMTTGIEDQMPPQPETPVAAPAAPRAPTAQTASQDVLARKIPDYPDAFGAEQGANRQVFERWNENLSGGRGLRGEVARIENWFERTFDLSYSALRVADAPSEIFEPSARTSVILAQGAGSGDASPWTMVAARSPEALGEGLDRLTAPEVWSGVGGRITSFQPGKQTITIEPVGGMSHFVLTEPIGFTNARLILANWMSTNILIYALAILFFCIVLGAGTSELLNRIGRRA